MFTSTMARTRLLAAARTLQVRHFRATSIRREGSGLETQVSLLTELLAEQNKLTRKQQKLDAIRFALEHLHNPSVLSEFRRKEQESRTEEYFRTEEMELVKNILWAFYQGCGYYLPKPLWGPAEAFHEELVKKLTKLLAGKKPRLIQEHDGSYIIRYE